MTLAQQLEALTIRVQALEDRAEIADLPRRYSRGIDRADWPLVRSCYTPGAIVRGSRRTLPASEYVAQQEIDDASFATTMHSMHNQVINVEGDHGTVDSYAVAMLWFSAERSTTKSAAAGVSAFVAQVGAPDLVLGVIYHDTVARTGEHWLIAHRYVEPVWRAGEYPVGWMVPG
jgi:hypothetical protein